MQKSRPPARRAAIEESRARYRQQLVGLARAILDASIDDAERLSRLFSVVAYASAPALCLSELRVVLPPEWAVAPHLGASLNQVLGAAHELVQLEGG